LVHWIQQSRRLSHCQATHVRREQRRWQQRPSMGLIEWTTPACVDHQLYSDIRLVWTMETNTRSRGGADADGSDAAAAAAATVAACCRFCTCIG
jgi:hypothetical protein